ncbi:MAG: SIR2 family NAD-dependent protein deacylase [Actinomycetota bacterium]
MTDEPLHAAAALLREGLERGRGVVALTGAGVSAASGIPTFRGPQGYWTDPTAGRSPQELATLEAFRRDPEVVWAWYLERLAACRAAQPNGAHHALVELEGLLGARFRLITQNVDGLHGRAGSARVFEVHGNLERCRCVEDCGVGLLALPEPLLRAADDRGPQGVGAQGRLTAEERAWLTCPGCGAWLRPHVLWFDEVYDEERFRFASSLDAASQAGLLLVVGTSGATTLPQLVVGEALRVGAVMLDCNPEDNPFAELAERAERGMAVRAPADEALPALVAAARG